MPRFTSFARALLPVMLLTGIAAHAEKSDAIKLAQASGAPAFAKLDSNGDGKVSLHEASANDELFVAFKQLDTNRDGDLTPAEFAAYSAK